MCCDLFGLRPLLLQQERPVADVTAEIVAITSRSHFFFSPDRACAALHAPPLEWDQPGVMRAGPPEHCSRLIALFELPSTGPYP